MVRAAEKLCGIQVSETSNALILLIFMLEKCPFYGLTDNFSLGNAHDYI